MWTQSTWTLATDAGWWLDQLGIAVARGFVEVPICPLLMVSSVGCLPVLCCRWLVVAVGVASEFNCRRSWCWLSLHTVECWVAAELCLLTKPHFWICVGDGVVVSDGFIFGLGWPHGPFLARFGTAGCQRQRG